MNTDKKDIPINANASQNTAQNTLDEKQRKHLQHEFKLYMERYFKTKLGKGVDNTKVFLFEDMMVIRGEGFLTEPEKYIVQTESGDEVVEAARVTICKQHSIDNRHYFEEMLQAKILHETCDVDAKRDFWVHILIFDRNFTS